MVDLKTFNALVINDQNGERAATIEQLTDSDLPDEEVLIDVEYSSLNYKDGLAATGQGIARRLPMVGGIDLVGTVVDGGTTEYQSGDRVLVTGWGLSEVHWGGYSQRQRVNPDWITRVPDGLSGFDCMAIGTAGYTAMLCVMALEEHNITADRGPVIVTGAAGGVGSVAISILSKLGYEIYASTGRESAHEYLAGLGASHFVHRNELSESDKPFQREIWAGGIDTVGGHTLVNVLAQVSYGGAVAACGLAGSSELPGSVLPFILRGVRLLGVDSVMAPKQLRQAAWDRLGSDLEVRRLRDIARIEPLTSLPELAKDIVAGQIRGRVVIDVNS